MAEYGWRYMCSKNREWDKALLVEFFNYSVPEKRDRRYKVVKGYKKTKYIVYDDGVVYHYIPQYDIAKRVKDYNLKGYRRITLTLESGKRYGIYVHRLVALLFILNVDDKPEVNHKNRNKADNRVENLEWVTKSENELHKRRTGSFVTEETKEKIRKANSGANSYRAKKVLCVETGEIFPTATSASLALGMSRNVVSQACNSGKAIKGRHWQYINQKLS